MLNKKVVAYALYTKNDPDTFLTLTRTKEQAKEYAHTLFRYDHEAHFIQWCSLRDLNEDDPKTWSEYYDTCISDDDKQSYLISKVYYNLDNILSMLRMFGGCIPLGCSFESDMEMDRFIEKVDKSKEITDGE